MFGRGEALAGESRSPKLRASNRCGTGNRAASDALRSRSGGQGIEERKKSVVNPQVDGICTPYARWRSIVNRAAQGYIITGLRRRDLRVRAAPIAGYVEIAILENGNRRSEPIVLTEAQCEALAQSLAMALYSG